MSKTTHAVVDRGGYIYKGVNIPKGRVVKMDSALFESTQRVQPSYFREATEKEVKGAETILDLSTVERATAQNQAEAEAAAASSSPTGKRRDS